MSCQLCQRIATALHPSSGYRVPRYYDTQDRRFVELGSWEELQGNRGCTTCSRIALLFEAEAEKNGSDLEAGEYRFWLFDFSGTHLCLRLESEVHKFWPSIHISPLAPGSSDRVGVVMDPHWVDFDRVSHWLENCDNRHAECHCQISASAALIPNRGGIFLISVSRECLIETRDREKYIALSYVWGSELSGFATTKANLAFLCSQGSFSNTAIQKRLPGTIRRAMRFTSLLGVDFLWVDRLCIVQDDPIHMASQMRSMAGIYSKSYLTLCAADGIDAESGLCGIRPCLQSRNLQQDILSFNDGSASVKWMPRTVSAYYERGWTFQEQTLSRRTLSFTKEGLEWRCRESYSQEQNLEICQLGSTYSHLTIVRADTSWPCLKLWDNLVASYTKRNLSYEEDILRAFMGVLETLGSCIPGGFHFGLPQLFFDAALLWVPKEYLTRRENHENRFESPAFPSWSWAGWRGARGNQFNAFGLAHERSNLVMSYKPRKIDIFPCVQWFKIDIDTFEKVSIPNDYAKFRVSGLEGSITLPLGWSSHQDADGGPYYYRYDGAPSSHTFWYPIPTSRDNQTTAENYRWDTVLYCKTWRGFLDVGAHLPQPEEDDEVQPLHSLRTDAGKWAGVIYVHQPPESADEQRQQCELVLISGGYALENTDVEGGFILEGGFAERPRSGIDYDFYHLLWIEWRGKLAYRKGLARVVMSVWNDLVKDEVELFLG